MRIAFEIDELYRNMGDVLKDYPELIENAMEAARRAGVEPFVKSMRGGSDGAALAFRGLPTPDLFTGGHNPRSSSSTQDVASRRAQRRWSISSGYSRSRDDRVAWNFSRR